MGDHIEKLSGLTTDELRAELRKALGVTVVNLLWIAAVWRELESRGDDLSQLKQGIGRYVSAIAAGTLLADTVVAFSTTPVLLNRAAKLPISEQREAVKSPDDFKVKSDAAAKSRTLPKKGRAVESSQRPTLDFLVSMVVNCSAPDAAELILKMVRGCSDPIGVAKLIAPAIDVISKQKRRE